MVRELSTLLLAGTATGTIQPVTVWNGIKAGKKIIEFIGEVPEWINYNQNLENHLRLLKRKTDCLESREADVVIELENTEHQSGRKRKGEVNHWLRRVRTKVTDVKKVEDDINTVSYLPRFLFRAWLGSCIGKEIDQVNDLVQQGSFTTGLLLDAPRDCGGPLVTSDLKGVVVAQKLDEIWEHLISPLTVRIGVQGPAGIGKTAVMAHIFNRLCSSCRVFYVNVPQDFSIYSLQASIAEELKVDHLPQTEGSEIRRAARLCQAFKSMKEFVLILDGLPKDFAIEDVGIPLEGNKGKIIVTSQCLNVCKRMLCQETVVLESLSQEDSENLFMEKLASDIPISEDIRNIARDIIQKCNGIPSKIIDMAVRLRGAPDVNEWLDTSSDM
ncbi:probable disease resistance protein At1g12290 [Chenopodium quinoa]|uniref:probable disease resistance protein At1g12290 n=1 Tax=Chenopodium quinoa TaxID=63459 RepID=UPI000B77D80C|nr:probable disease resistance protein At1g12290 [Chenopodium quinoa]XP_021758754.1 probable disease resistance protein At1g12290 [Chenopodium quinoa]XP_021758755.1 probable disease resistance protein At1g12290 [Chenopodium quinoa]XP_021758756.1 probable disease resistance protein At1g12290 [Chenopodium quinoa]XP_021758757.1 probable disease resistance protein At1g12290 [Chenopodium quinoa]XP_021758758.1 probable disease resistance protein At1g12290 [Chenopodium quinoa]